MKKTASVLLLTLMLFPLQGGFSQIYDTGSTLGVATTSYSPYTYESDDGHTVITGEIENKLDFPVTGVTIWGGFYDGVRESPLESVIGSSVLDVIPAKGKSPYKLVSTSPNPEITNVSVLVQGFTSTGEKLRELSLAQNSLEVTDRLAYAGTITNNAGTVSQQTKVHLAMYDRFEPPRLLRIITQELEDIPPGGSSGFSFDETHIQQTVRLAVFAESDNSLSNILDANVPAPGFLTKQVTINDVSIHDAGGEKISDIPVNSNVTIKGNIWIQVLTADEQLDHDYVYYTQVKQFGKNPVIEYLGSSAGHFDRPESQSPEVSWTPENKGLYFVETYVWDSDGIPLAAKGPIVLVAVS